MKLSVDAWINRFSDLTPKNQLTVAKAIVEELELNRELTLEDEEDNDFIGYDLEQSEKIENIIYAYIYNAIKKEKLAEEKEVLESFMNLPEEIKKEVIKIIITIMEYETKNYQEQEQIKKCELDGHDYTNWCRYVKKNNPEYHEHEVFKVEKNPDGSISYTEPETRIYKEEQEQIIWKRYCKKCGFVEIADSYEETQKLVKKISNPKKD